jgi:hypothetical protein
MGPQKQVRRPCVDEDGNAAERGFNERYASASAFEQLRRISTEAILSFIEKPFPREKSVIEVGAFALLASAYPRQWSLDIAVAEINYSGVTFG